MQEYKSSIAAKVRELRKERRWNQSELASRIGLSQNRLSEIERGGGSFSAEQLVLLLQLFNVGISEFAGDDGSTDSQLQNALARLGASHVRETDNVVPSERLEEVNRVVVEVLVDGSARLVSALAPVIVANIDRVGLRRIDADLVSLGLENRLGWLVENVEAAIRQELSGTLDTTRRKQYQRAAVQLEQYLASRSTRLPTGSPTDILDSSIRSSSTLEQIKRTRSKISARWNVVSELTPDDFVEALRGASESV